MSRNDEDPLQPAPDEGAPTTDRLRKDIDRGETGDKVGYPDPATAPLGTDAEAGGVPPSREEVAEVRRAEVEGRTAAPVADPGRPIATDRPGDPATHRGGPDVSGSRKSMVWAIVAAIVLILLLWWIF